VAEVGIALQEARALHEVRPAVGDRVEEERDLLRGVLVVARHHHRDVVPVLDRIAVPGSQRRPHANRPAERQHRRAKRAGYLGGAVGRAVVDDQHLVD